MNTSIDLTISQLLISNFFHKVYILKYVTKDEFKWLNRIVTSNSTSRGTSTTAICLKRDWLAEAFARRVLR